VPELITGGLGDPGDRGDADPAVAAVLTAFGAGQESEHAALMALASTRLLVPIVAVVAGEAGGEQQDGRHADGRPADGRAVAAVAGHEQAGPQAEAVEGGVVAREVAGSRRPRRRDEAGRPEKVSEMALPTLVGKDGRRAVLAFTCLDALARWRPDARPVPVPASRVWLAARFEASAAVIDVAGPVPMVVDGMRLSALAAGKAVPLPQDDPDVHAAARDIFTREPALTNARLAEPGAGGDVGVQVTLAAGADPVQAGDAIQRAVASFVAATGGRFRRGVEVSVVGGGPAAGSR
jgi:SseB protein N-terminal domain